MKKYFLSYLLFFMVSFCFSQNKQIDSLKFILKTAKEDSNKVKALNEVGWNLINTGSYDSAMLCANTAKTLAATLGFKNGIANAYNNIGNVYYSRGNYPQALKNYFSFLKIKEEMGNKRGIATAYNNIGNVYYSQCNYPQALKNQFAALQIREEIGDKEGIAASYNNIAIVYTEQGNYPEALKNHFAALKIREEIGDKAGYAVSYNNIGSVYYSLGNYPKALQNHFAALKIEEEIGSKDGITQSWLNIGSTYINLKNYSEAEVYNTKGLALAKEIGSLEDIKEGSQNLSAIYAATNKPLLALQYYKAYIAARDSLLNEENTKKTIQQAMQYEFDKKQATDSLKTAEEKQLSELTLNAEKSKNRIVLALGSFVLLLVVVFALFMAHRLKLTRRQKTIIERQKAIVDEKHKEISDSINYAERIQRSFLATKQLLDANLSFPSGRPAGADYFVFFQPKDVVSGDFYWASKLKNNQFALVTADSTGHGVPGAIMSILNISCLNETIKEGYVEPGEILNHTRSKIIEILKRDGSAEGGKDGMDCSLISFDFVNNKLTYAAANNPIWIVRGKELLEFAPDKIPVGKHDKDAVSFTQHTIELQKKDVIYTLTDGMPDQFGGLKAKKFMYKQLKELLISIAQLPMQEQKEKLTFSLNSWKGNLEQVDDITLIGVRV